MEERKIFIVAGLGFGDEGKGTITDFLSKLYNAKLVCRYNGGPQAAHYVRRSNGILHCFAQYGSGTFWGAKTYISEKMLVDPIKLGYEANALGNKGIKHPLWVITIDPDCLVVTPFHRIVNQMLELSRGGKRRGSCGFGVGEAVNDGRNYGEMALRMKDLSDKETLRTKLDFLWRIKMDIAQQIANEHRESIPIDGLLYELEDKEWVEKLVLYYYRFAKAVKIAKVSGEEISGNIIFEGAQGILLDEERGFYPHITRSRTTFKNAEDLIGSMGLRGRTVKIGVIRAYATRHGAGPFVTYVKRLSRLMPDTHNATNNWQGEFRIGWFDLVATRYALEVAGGVDFVAMTNLDRISFEKIKVCVGYKYIGRGRRILEQYFDLSEDGKVITGIKMPATATREHQEKLTKFLAMCRPVYRKVHKAEYIKYLEKELNVKIAIISNGPTAEDKIELLPLY